MRTKLVIIGALSIIVVALAINVFVQRGRAEKIPAQSFAECVQRGNPVMESLPRQCRDESGLLHVEVSAKVDPPEVFHDPRMTVESARTIAYESELCAREGRVGEFETYDSASGTWWFMIVDSPKEYCAPACVVLDDMGGTEVRWRCDGDTAE